MYFFFFLNQVFQHIYFSSFIFFYYYFYIFEICLNIYYGLGVLFSKRRKTKRLEMSLETSAKTRHCFSAARLVQQQITAVYISLVDSTFTSALLLCALRSPYCLRVSPPGPPHQKRTTMPTEAGTPVVSITSSAQTILQQ